MFEENQHYEETHLQDQFNPGRGTAKSSGRGYWDQGVEELAVVKDLSPVLLATKDEAVDYVAGNPDGVALFFQPHSSAKLIINDTRREITLKNSIGHQTKPLYEIFEVGLGPIGYTGNPNCDLNQLN